MALQQETSPRFTQWVVQSGVLEDPFVLFDIGVQGGIHPRWAALGGALAVYGFDALEEAVAPLRDQQRPGHHYFALALGNEDGERILHIQDIACSSSLYATDAQSRYATDPGIHRNRLQRTVPISRIDSLVEQGKVPNPDFIKIDCEGFEPEILSGASRTLAQGLLLGAEIETNFNVSPVLPETHFWASYSKLLRARLLLFDLEFERTPYATFVNKAQERRAPPQRLISTSRPSTFNVLFCRDFGHERRSPESFPGTSYGPPSADQLIKTIVLLELYGMRDAAFELLAAFPEILGDRLSPDHAATLLVPSWKRLGRSFTARLWRRARYEVAKRSRSSRSTIVPNSR